MSAFPAFVLGLLLGWIIEWIIDWLYWRRRMADGQKENILLKERLAKLEARNAELEGRLATQTPSPQNRNTPLVFESKMVEEQIQPVRFAAEPTGVEQPQAEPANAVSSERDDLILIKGIGPVISGKLNQAGVYTFEALARLTPDELRGMVGNVISQLANEEDILTQAKQFAANKQRRG